MKINKDRVDILVYEHWEYVERITKLTYETAFRHGYKHGFEDRGKK